MKNFLNKYLNIILCFILIFIDLIILLNAVNIENNKNKIGAISENQPTEIVILSMNNIFITDSSIVQEIEEGTISENIIEEIIYNEEDLKYLSSIIWCEAGNQCEAGQQAVGIIVMNRKEHEAFADSVKEVIYEKGQFTPAHNGKLTKALSDYDNGNLSENSIEAAKYALAGNTTVNYNNAIIEMDSYLYFNGVLSNAKLRIQDHLFK